jgi:hypothetical protein
VVLLLHSQYITTCSCYVHRIYDVVAIIDQLLALASREAAKDSRYFREFFEKAHISYKVVVPFVIL